MGVKIIDNKKIELTEDEFKAYHDICRSYDRPACRGEELFKGLFETDDNGMIVFLRPPSNRHTSMEVFLFIVSIMHQQTVRRMEKQVNDMCRDMKARVDKMLDEIKK